MTVHRDYSDRHEGARIERGFRLLESGDDTNDKPKYSAPHKRKLPEGIHEIKHIPHTWELLNPNSVLGYGLQDEPATKRGGLTH